MEKNISPLQALFIWRLLVAGGEGWVKDLKPKLDAKVRKDLESMKFIAVEPRQQENKRRAHYAVLLDQGWHWAEQHLDHQLPAQSNAALFILREVMARIKRRVAQGDFSLADFFSSTPSPAVESSGHPSVRSNDTPSDLKRRIIGACQHLSAGVHSGRIRLADLRSSLSDVARDQMDQTLRDMEVDHSIVVSPLDNPREISHRDEDAALKNSSNDPRHIVYLQPSG